MVGEVSRTRKGAKSPGSDFWSRRPFSGLGHGPFAKRRTHRAERQRAKAVRHLLVIPVDQDFTNL